MAKTDMLIETSNLASTSNHATIVGNVTLKYLLDEIVSAVKHNSSRARHLVEQYLMSYFSPDRLSTSIIIQDIEFFEMDPIKGKILDHIICDLHSEEKTPISSKVNIALMLGNLARAAYFLESGYMARLHERMPDIKPEDYPMQKKLEKSLKSINSLLNLGYSTDCLHKLSINYASGFQANSWAIDPMAHHATLDFDELNRSLKREKLPYANANETSSTKGYLDFLSKNINVISKILSVAIDVVRRYDLDRFNIKVNDFDNATYSFFEHSLTDSQMRKTLSSFAILRAFEKKADAHEKRLTLNEWLLDYITSEDNTREMGARKKIQDELGINVKYVEGVADAYKYALYRGIREISAIISAFSFDGKCSLSLDIGNEMIEILKPYSSGMKTIIDELDVILGADDASYTPLRSYAVKMLGSFGYQFKDRVAELDVDSTYYNIWSRYRSHVGARDYSGILEDILLLSRLPKFNERNPDFVKDAIYHTLLQIAFLEINSMFEEWNGKYKGISFSDYIRTNLLNSQNLEKAKNMLVGMDFCDDKIIATYLDKEYYHDVSFNVKRNDNGKVKDITCTYLYGSMSYDNICRALRDDGRTTVAGSFTLSAYLDTPVSTVETLAVR